MTHSEQAIGIFDSGVGGLTVLKQVRKLLPHEEIIYLGDTARVPYGTKSPETVLNYSIRNTHFLMKKGIKALVVACNTASAFALDRLDLSIPSIGVIAPGALKATKSSKNNRVGVIGTEGTIQSESYLKAIQKINPQIKVFSKACPLLVALAEEGRVSGPIVDLVLKEYLTFFLEKSHQIDSLILGCTHYPLFKKAMSSFLGKKIQLIDSAIETALSLKEILSEKKLLNPLQNPGELTLYSTDAPARMERIGGWFLGGPMCQVVQADI